MRRLALGVVLAAVGAGLSCGGAPSGPAPAASGPSPPEAREPPVGPGTDFVLITIDTLRADAPGFAGNGAVSTPNLDRLARTGRRFPSAYAHNVVTLPSHTNILTGRYPYQHGVRENSGFKLRTDVPTLATVLGEAGYATGAFVAAFTLDARFGLARGFDVYDDHYPSGSHADQYLAAERRGDEVIRLAVDWWRENAGKPRFLWVHLYDPHAPYAAPEPFASRHPDRPYLAEVEATDSFLGPLLALFSEESPPLVVVTGDHGEALGDHGELTHGLFCYQATLKVPLLLWGAGIVPGTDERLAGHVDIVPTVLGLLGVEAPAGLPGRSLLAPPEPGRMLYFESLTSFFNRGWAPLRGVLKGTSKMIELPIPELYDLARDPQEQENLFATDRDRFQKMRRGLAGEATWPPEERGTVAPEEAAALRSLGYAASRAPRKTSFSPEDDPKRLVEIDQTAQRFILAYSEGNYELAADLARQVIAARPDMALGYERLAMALRQMERPGEAIAVLGSALERGIANEELLRQLGWTYAENGMPRKAVAVLAPFAKSDDIETLNALGIALSDAGRDEEALEVLRRSLGFDPNEPKTLESLGVVTLRAQRVGEAKQYLERALELNENLPYSWNTLGVAHAFEGDQEAAMTAWEKSIQLDPHQYDALYNLGMTAARAGQTDRARRALELYVSTAPPDRFGPDIAKARQALSALH